MLVSEESDGSSAPAEPLALLPLPPRPWFVMCALVVSGMNAVVATGFGIAFVLGVGYGFGGLQGALLSLLIVSPPIALFWTAFGLMRRRARWGYWLGTLSSGLIAVLLGLIWADEPKAYFENTIDALADPLSPVAGFMLVWAALVLSNGAAAIALLQPRARAWFGLGDWWWRRLTIG